MISQTSEGVMPLAMLERTIAKNPLIPHLPSTRQIRFLELECGDALYGGAAGGGKSDALLMAALQFWEVPGYAALILRRTFADLKKPGALLDRSQDWFAPMVKEGKARYNSQDHRWYFSTGSTLQFGYCDNDADIYQYQSSEYQFIGFDEATQFTEIQLRYLFSRLRRRTTIPVPLRYRLASNPGNVGHAFVKSRYINPGEAGRKFIPAKLHDNPGIDAKSYIENLGELDPVTRAQLLTGDWDSVPGGRFKKDWFRYYTRRGDYIVLRHPDEGEKPFSITGRLVFCTVDPAASAKTTADYTVCSTWTVSPWGDLVWLGCLRVRKEIPDIVPLLQNVVLRYKPAYMGIEAVAANRGVFQLAQRAQNPAVIAKPLDPAGQDKLVHASRAMALASSGRLYLPISDPSFPLEDVEGELIVFTGGKQDAHDDIVDTLSYAVSEMASANSGRAKAMPMVIGG